MTPFFRGKPLGLGLRLFPTSRKLNFNHIIGEKGGKQAETSPVSMMIMHGVFLIVKQPNLVKYFPTSHVVFSI